MLLKTKYLFKTKKLPKTRTYNLRKNKSFLEWITSFQKDKFLNDFLLQIKNWYKKASDYYVQKHRATFISNLDDHEVLIMSKFQYTIISTVGCIKGNESQNCK